MRICGPERRVEPTEYLYAEEQTEEGVRYRKVVFLLCMYLVACSVCKKVVLISIHRNLHPKEEAAHHARTPL
jgi:hypothetical protein